MNMKAQSDKNIAASQRAAILPSGCKACERQGVAIYPLRVAAVPRRLVSPGWLPAVPEQETVLSGGEFKYALRTLREGYVYILLDNTVWQGYQVTGAGFLRQFDAYDMPQGERVEPLSPACLTHHHDVIASFINIPPGYKEAKVAFSSDPWSRTVLDEYQNATRPDTRFIHLTLADNQVTVREKNRSLTLKPDLKALTTNVLEFATESYLNITGEGGKSEGAHGFYPRMSQEKQVALANRVALLQQQFVAPVCAIVLDDPVGVVQELNHARLDVITALSTYTGKAENIHQKMISDAIVQIRTFTARQIENDPTIKNSGTPGTSYAATRESQVAIKIRQALNRMEEYYDEPARERFADTWQGNVAYYTQQQSAIWQDLNRAHASALWLAVLNNDYSPETSVLSWACQLRTLAACLQGGLAGYDTGQLKKGDELPRWATWLSDPCSPPLMALLRNKQDFSEAVFNGTLTYPNLKAVLNSKEASNFVNSKYYQQRMVSLISAIGGAFSTLESTLSEQAKVGVTRILQGVTWVAEGGPAVTVFSGELTMGEYQRLLNHQLNVHGKPVLSGTVKENGRTVNTSRTRRWVQITDPVQLARRIQVRLTAPLNNPGRLSGISGLTSDVIDSSLTRGEIALSGEDMRRVARFVPEISTDLQSGVLGIVLAVLLARNTFSNLNALNAAMPGDVSAEMSVTSGSLIVLSTGVEIIGQSAAVLNLFNRGDLLIRGAGVLGGLAGIVDGVALGMRAKALWQSGDKTAAGLYASASFITLISGGVATFFSAAGNFALFNSGTFLLGPVGWCIALGVLAVTLIAIGDHYVRSPLERWLTHTCFGNIHERDGDKICWHKESLAEMQEAMTALHVISSGMSAQLRGDWLTELTNNTALLGNRMVAARVLLGDCSPTGSDWLAELVAVGRGGRQVLARSGSAAKLAGLTAPEPQTYEKSPLKIGRGELTPAVITTAVSATTLTERWSGTADTPRGLQLDGEFPLNTSRYTRAELTVTYWPDKTRPDDSLQLTTTLDS